ncbi:YbjQ family protein [Ruegeria sp. HKCCA6707]|uniref:YbjQ family protein n=1 Tax=Ruegeria sp. HKCCA6707 TaxID=2682996 RepID=UPI001487C1AA|nr:YbjQ family protein [Ruegeria sp. HKCCA6707]
MICKDCGTEIGWLNSNNGYCKNCHIKQMGLQARGETAQHAEKRRIEQKAHNDAVDAVMVTTETAHNLPVSERLGIVAGETVLGLNAFKDLAADLRGLVGGNSATIQKAMRDAREEAIQELKAQAHKLNADAVVGINIDYHDIGSTAKMMMVAATGTAVKLEGTA